MSLFTRKPKTPEKLQLKSAHFYVDREGKVWCCYQIDTRDVPQAQAKCVRIQDSRLDYFYIDGCYDRDGNREHTLVRELPYKDAWLNETYEVKWHVDLPSTDYIARDRGL